MVKTTLVLFLSFVSMQLVFSQNCQPAPSCQSVAKYFSNCAAVFFNDKMMVNDYSPKGKCVIEEGMKGSLQVSSVQLTPNLAIPVEPVKFKVAIRNDETNTLWLFSDEPYTEIPVEDILAKCKKGDKIVLLTLDSEFALPHNEIEIMWGC